MRFRNRRRSPEDIRASADAAVTAREEAAGRLAETRDLIAAQAERARRERATIIAAIRRMREQDSLAGLILDDLERGAGGDTGADSGGTHQ
jgi:hypothetical protein